MQYSGKGKHDLEIELKPLISEECKQKILSFIKNDSIMFEIGSGGSTIMFSKKCKKLYSLESSQLWFNKVNKYINDNNLDNIEYYCVLPNDPNVREKHTPGISRTYEQYKDYVDKIDDFDDNFFDVIFIDGVARPHCYLKSFNKIKSDGYVIIHDFYNGDFSNPNWSLDKEWNYSLLFKYYETIDKITQIKGKPRGNDVIILKKKNDVLYNPDDMKELDKKIPRW